MIDSTRYNTGSTLRAFYFNFTPAGPYESQVWNGSAFEAWDDSHYTSYAVATNELGTSGRYVANAPAGVLTAGCYAVEFRVYSGTLAADPVISSAGPDTAIMYGIAAGGNMGTVQTVTPTANITANALRTGTAQGGSASTITLDSGASAVNSFYDNSTVAITGGTGAGQDAPIASYVGATKVVTIVGTWATNPDSSSVFAILPGAGGGSGSGDIVAVTPIQASVTNPRYATRDLAPIAQGSTPTDAWTVTTGAGLPLNLAGKTVRLVAYTEAEPVGDCNPFDLILTPQFKYETGGNGIIVSGTDSNIVSVTHSAANTAKAQELRYWLLDVTDLLPIATGKMPIKPAVWNA
jgi:hypothetical protein